MTKIQKISPGVSGIENDPAFNRPFKRGRKPMSREEKKEKRAAYQKEYHRLKRESARATNRQVGREASVTGPGDAMTAPPSVPPTPDPEPQLHPETDVTSE